MLFRLDFSHLVPTEVLLAKPRAEGGSRAFSAEKREKCLDFG